MTSMLAFVGIASGGAEVQAAARQNHLPAVVARATAANCGSARVCAFILAGGGIARAKNVTKSTNPSLGTYCITPKSGTISPNQVVPTVTPEWSTSSGNSLMAFYSDAKLGCPSNALEVLTYDTSGNLSSGVSFNLVVN